MSNKKQEELQRAIRAQSLMIIPDMEHVPWVVAHNATVRQLVERLLKALEEAKHTQN